MTGVAVQPGVPSAAFASPMVVILTRSDTQNATMPTLPCSGIPSNRLRFRQGRRVILSRCYHAKS
jgi:hypothetical protein